MSLVNTQCRLAARPVGLPASSDWDIVDVDAPAPGDGEILVEVQYLSIDPGMRGWMNPGSTYMPGVEIAEVMRALAIGRIVASRHLDFVDGDVVSGMFGVQRYALSTGAGVTKLDTSLAPAPAYLGVLGISGLTAYFGLLEIGRLMPGETVLVSGAAGSVGSVVGQIAKAKGCQAIGIAGGQDKCRWLVDEVGFDAAIDYKSEVVQRKLRETCPNGIDVFFDNVGGEILDAALANLARKARVAICGAVSQYNSTTPVQGPKNYMMLLVARARMEGFLVFDYADRYAEAAREMLRWIKEGKLASREHVEEGIDQFPSTLLKLFSGENFGKLLLKVGADPSKN